MISPSSTVNVTPATAGSPPNRFSMSVSSSSATVPGDAADTSLRCAPLLFIPLLRPHSRLSSSLRSLSSSTSGRFVRREWRRKQQRLGVPRAGLVESLWCRPLADDREQRLGGRHLAPLRPAQ